MYILTRAEFLENCKDNIYLVHDADIEERYLNAGYHRSERSYRIKEQYKEFTVTCPEFRNGKKGAEPVVIIPSFLVPRRPYPVYVYMYAIELYGESPEKSQRWVAEETRKHFGLRSFAHTTLGRALKAFIHKIRETAKSFEEDAAESPGGDKASGFPTTRMTSALRKQAVRFLNGIPVKSGKGQAVIAFCELAEKWFKVYGRFLL